MKKALIIIIPVALAGSVVLWKYYHSPGIAITKQDHDHVTVKIGNQTVDYTYNQGQALSIPKVGLFFSAKIEPNEGTVKSSTVSVYRGSKLMDTQIINFK